MLLAWILEGSQMKFNRLGNTAAGIAGLSLAACAHPPAPAPATGGFHVVALGDSYASGQGAPNDRWWLQFWKSHWDDKRCNRSKWAPTSQAVERLNAQGHGIEYHSFTCSGAEITKGLIGPYDGQEPPLGDPPLAPQVDELAALAKNPGDVDAVTISAGGNDALFGYIVAVCMLPTPKCEIIRSVVDDALDALPGHFKSLADEIEAKVKIDSDRILLVGYPDPTRRSDGTFCDREPVGDALAGIDRDEAEWAAEYVLPKLNRSLCNAAEDYGWTYVAPAEEFETRGWCSDPIKFQENWLNTALQSLAKQGTHRGMMHPTRDGHTAVSERIEDRIETLLNGGTLQSDSCPDEPDSAP